MVLASFKLSEVGFRVLFLLANRVRNHEYKILIAVHEEASL